MQLYQNSRRNFLSSFAILSAGTAFKPAIKHLPGINTEEDLQKKWESFWKKSGGKKFYTLNDLKNRNIISDTKGHLYKNGETIYFSKENILAQPTWIFWGNDILKPADVIITLFENNSSLKKIARLNRFEADALYKLFSHYPEDKLFTAYNNSLKPNSNETTFIKNKITVKKNSQLHQLSYYKDKKLVTDKKFIYHS
jgi:hypothetical protein